ncbi:MAG: UDP-N-acetylglucosamine--N-acetylmuramyl-(pentapeptide) pyrophosphoryl-undecaprenol N-acetylglucosamine transferase, partial [Planctomycetota bacterium]|nr:UDP-N-acetylglucosamine--N-acetylmuramyl-(pentapeptide) pyrophosphoryl-undecaprenol N-acetylglucosamine transferase [Planctomycetota bacterium]
MRLLFSAGGTGGHIMPLLAVADKVKSFQPEVEVLFIVGGRSIDKTIVSSIPYPVVHLPLKKGVEGVYSGLKLAFKTLFAFNLPILRLVTSSRGVVTSGSYVSLLPILCALATTRPIYLIEPNAYPGKFTRFFGRFCRKVFGGWHTLRRNLSETNLSITGVPLRSGFSKNLTAREARTVLGISEKKVVLLVLGGSQG